MTQLLSITRAAEQLDCSRGHVYGLEAFIEENTRSAPKGGGSREVRRGDGT